MKITVTQEHIDRGRAEVEEARSMKRRGIAVISCCAVAQALNAVGLGPSKAFLSTANVWTNDGLIQRSVDLPWEVGEWIQNFDAGVSVEPFTFELDVEP